MIRLRIKNLDCLSVSLWQTQNILLKNKIEKKTETGFKSKYIKILTLFTFLRHRMRLIYEIKPCPTQSLNVSLERVRTNCVMCVWPERTYSLANGPEVDIPEVAIHGGHAYCTHHHRHSVKRSSCDWYHSHHHFCFHILFCSVVVSLSCRTHTHTQHTSLVLLMLHSLLWTNKILQFNSAY